MLCYKSTSLTDWFIGKIENFQIRAYAGCESKKFPRALNKNILSNLCCDPMYKIFHIVIWRKNKFEEIWGWSVDQDQVKKSPQK